MSSHRTRKRDIFKWSRHGAKDPTMGDVPKNNGESSQNVGHTEVPGLSLSLRSKNGIEDTVTADPASLKLTGFWKEAYEKLEAENPKIIQAYEKAIAQFNSSGDSSSQNKNSDMPLEEVVKKRLQEIKDARLKFVISGREIVVREQVSRAIHLLISAKDLISTAISSEPHASLAWAGILILLDPIAKSTTQDDDAMDGLEKISHLMIRYRILESTPMTVSSGKSTTPLEELEASIKSQIIHLYTEILKYQMQLASHLSKSGLFRFFEDLTGSDDWKGMSQGMKDIDEGIHNSLRSLSAHSLKSIEVQVEKIDRGMEDLMKTMQETKEELTETRHTQLLSSLNIAEGSMFNSFQDRHKAQCLQGTQANPLKQVQTWCENPRSKQIYWLAGMPGTGKSTIARTLASACHNRTPLVDGKCLRENIILGACFFFDKTEGNRRTTLRFFTTLCRGLTDCLPAMKPAVCETISNKPNIGNQSISTQWQDLILSPLAEVDKRSLIPLTLILVIDALDECEDENDIDTIIQLLSQPQPFNTISLKLFITSRPENPIRSSFNRIPEMIFERFPLGKIGHDDEESDDDITKLLKHELAIIAHKRELPDDWPGKEEIQILTSKSGGLFIYAATVCRFLGGSKLKNYQLEIRLKSIFSDRVGADSPQSSLDEIYTHILKLSVIGDAIDEEMEELFSRFQAVIGAIVNLAEPLSIANIAQLISFRCCDVKDTLEELQSVISFENDHTSPIQLLHLSFRDFLFDDTRCLVKGFLISQSQAHMSLLQNCLDVLSKTLRQDICGLSDKSICAKDVEPARVNRDIPGDVQYACLHWVYHFQQAAIEPLDDGNVHQFLKVHLLHWLEALSLMRKMSEGMRRVIDLSSYIQGLSSTGRGQMRSFAYDIRRFALKFRGLIEETPLELYTSALLYVPENTWLRKYFGTPKFCSISHLPPFKKQWDPLEQTFFTGSGQTHDVALSPDGKLVASSCMRVWETTTGTLIQEINTEFVHTKVEFSSDGKHLISLSLEPAVRVWDLATGILIKEMKGKPRTDSSVYVSVLSKDLSLAAFSNQLGEIQAFHLDSEIQSSIDGGDQYINSLAVSSNGKLIALSVQGRIQIRNPLSGALYKELLCPYEFIAYRGGPVVGFSPDGGILAASVQGQSPLFWSCETWELLSITGGPYGTSIFLPNGDILMVKSERTHVSIVRYDTKSGNTNECGKLMRNWDSERETLRCSDDGTLITIIAGYTFGHLRPGSSNFKFNVWNIATGKPLVELDGHSRKPHEAKFSTDNTKILSASDDGTIRLWDLELESSFDEGSSCDEDSYNVQRIVRGSSNQTQFTIIECQSTSWDLQIGLHQALLVPRDLLSRATAFSPDRSTFICRVPSPVGNYHHWQVVNTVTGDIVHQIPSFDNQDPFFVHFSANNSVLATVFHDDSESALIPAESDACNLEVDGVNYGCLINFFSFSTGRRKAFRSPMLSNLKLSPDGGLVALAFRDPNVSDFTRVRTVFEIRDVTTWNLVKSQKKISGITHTIEWSSGGHIIMIACSSHLYRCEGIQLWDLTTDKIVPFIKATHAKASAFSPDDRYCVIDLNDGVIQLHDLTSMTKTERPGLPSKLFQANSNLVEFDWRFSEDGKVIETDLGRIDIQSFTGKVESWPNNSLFVDGDWVVRGVEKVLRLPAAEDIKCATAIRDTLLVVYMSNRLELLDFRVRE